MALASYLLTATLSSPVTPFVARLRAEGSARVAYALVVRRLGVACALLGLALIPVLNAAGEPLLKMLGVGSRDPSALAPALEYYRVRVAGVPAILLNALAVGVFRCVLGVERVMTWLQRGTSIVLIVLFTIITPPGASWTRPRRWWWRCWASGWGTTSSRTGSPGRSTKVRAWVCIRLYVSLSP